MAGVIQSGGPWVVVARPGHVAPARVSAPGLVARISPIRGVTPKRVLRRAIYLPAVLNAVTQSESATHNEYETLSAGTFSQPAMGPANVGQLRTVPLDALILAWDAKWLTVSGQNVVRLRNSLFGVLRARVPVHLLVTFHPHAGAFPEVDMKVTMRSATRELRPHEGDTHYISVQISEWRDPAVGRNSSRAPAEVQSGRWIAERFPTTHVLKAGDTLASLSNLYYMTYADWRLIRDANGIPKQFGQKTPIVNLPGRFAAGTKIKIPKRRG